MTYIKPAIVRRMPVKPRPRSFLGLGGYSDTDQCSTIPIGDPYRKPGMYCATPDGGTTTFNADGSTYRAPGAVDPDPAHPAGAGGGSFLDKIFGAAGNLFGGPTVPQTTMPVQTGMSTTTMIALAGGAVVVIALLARKK